MVTKAVIFLQGLKIILTVVQESKGKTEAKLKGFLLASCCVLNVSRLSHRPGRKGAGGYSRIWALLEKGFKVIIFVLEKVQSVKESMALLRSQMICVSYLFQKL